MDVPRYLFVNENIAGHRTVHANLSRVFAERDDAHVDFLHVPPASGLRRLGASRVPGLAAYDADLQPLRAQLLAADWVRRRLNRIASHYDALHFYTHNAALRSTAIMDRVPSVVSSDSTNLLNSTRIHGRVPSRATPYAADLGRRVETPVYRHARRITPSSQWVRHSLLRDYHVDPARVEVMPMGILVPDLDLREHGDRRPRIGFVGNPFDRKGGEWLLRLHENQWKDRADLLLVTTSPVPTSPGIEVVSDLTAGDPRLWSLLTSCDLFAFPSAIDQAPNAVLEAMAAGLPVVALDVGAIGEMVLQGVTGLVVRPGDEAGFGQAVSALIDDPMKRRAMGAAGRERVDTVFNMRRTASRLLEILGDVAWEQGR